MRNVALCVTPIWHATSPFCRTLRLIPVARYDLRRQKQMHASRRRSVSHFSAGTKKVPSVSRTGASVSNASFKLSWILISFLSSYSSFCSCGQCRFVNVYRGKKNKVNNDESNSLYIYKLCLMHNVRDIKNCISTTRRGITQDMGYEGHIKPRR